MFQEVSADLGDDPGWAPRRSAPMSSDARYGMHTFRSMVTS
ncbi:Hypothetical protein A7982_09325 [Minicystis rosea]|nr:Hypothetical protein A7982_09325 [Minicystis rosea]